MESIEDVLHKDMTRQEFLATLGFGIASIFGIGTIIKFFLGKRNPNVSGRVDMGYGSSIYGGKK